MSEVAAHELAPAGEGPPGSPLLLAGAALDLPIAPELGRRCPRCGERLPAADASTCSRCGVAVRSAEAGERLRPRGTWVGELLRGASYVFRGWGRLVSTPSLWKFAIVPFLLNVAVIALAVWLAHSVVGEWLVAKTGDDALRAWNEAGWLWWLLAKVVYVLGVIAYYLAFIFIPLLATWLLVAFPFGIVYKLIFMPFMELLSEATDRAALGLSRDQPFELARFYANLVVAIVDAFLLTGLQGVIYLLLLPINAIPFAGSFLWFLLPPAIFAGMDFSDINLVRRGYTTREKWRLWRHHQWRFLGYGVSFFFLLTIPVVNAFVIPAAAVGGALLFLELDRK